MLTVQEAIDHGWEVVLPVQRAVFDPSIILMRHKRADGKLELGHARAAAGTAAGLSSRAAALAR